MGNCFNGCRALKEMDLSIFDTTSLSNIRGLLSGALALTSVVFFNDIRNGVYAQEAFMDCTSLETFEATHYVEFVDSNSVQGIGQMFAYCESLKTLDLTS
jgi:surface protein